MRRLLNPIMNIIGLQWNTRWENKSANHVWLAAWLAANPPEQGTLVILPEMWATGFSMDVAAITETPGLETETFMAAQAKSYGIGLLGGVVTTGAGGLGRNEIVLFGPNGLEAARYAKMHPFTYGGESQYYERGSEVVLFEWEGFKVAPFICYDLRFPEVFRAAVSLGAEVFCVPANWPETRADHWITLLKARAIENQAYVIGVNRCGDDPVLHYGGRSLIFGPRGEVLAEAGTNEGAIQSRLDKVSLQRYRQEFPVLADIHPNYVGMT